MLNVSFARTSSCSAVVDGFGKLSFAENVSIPDHYRSRPRSRRHRHRTRPASGFFDARVHRRHAPPVSWRLRRRGRRCGGGPSCRHRRGLGRLSGLHGVEQHRVAHTGGKREALGPISSGDRDAEQPGSTCFPGGDGFPSIKSLHGAGTHVRSTCARFVRGSERLAASVTSSCRPLAGNRAFGGGRDEQMVVCLLAAAIALWMASRSARDHRFEKHPRRARVVRLFEASHGIVERAPQQHDRFSAARRTRGSRPRRSRRKQREMSSAMPSACRTSNRAIR